MSALRLFLAVVLLSAGYVHAQSAGEISFWDSVRDSKNPIELQAYIDQYPNGAFVALAKSRLAAIGYKPAAPAAARPSAAAATSTSPAAVTSATRMPQEGDIWAYQLTYPRLRGQWGVPKRAPAMMVFKAGAVSEKRIVDHLSIDGGTPSEVAHAPGSYLSAGALSLFSPYLAAFEDVAQGRRWNVVIREGACPKSYRCEAKARRVGEETVKVPAGTFKAIRIVIDEEWAPFSVTSTLGSAGADMTGGRTLTVWYSPELKRAVKYTSRLVAGAIPPTEATFDLELVSYQVK